MRFLFLVALVYTSRAVPQLETISSESFNDLELLPGKKSSICEDKAGEILPPQKHATESQAEYPIPLLNAFVLKDLQFKSLDSPDDETIEKDIFEENHGLGTVTNFCSEDDAFLAEGYLFPDDVSRAFLYMKTLDEQYLDSYRRWRISSQALCYTGELPDSNTIVLSNK